MSDYVDKSAVHAVCFSLRLFGIFKDGARAPVPHNWRATARAYNGAYNGDEALNGVQEQSPCMHGKLTSAKSLRLKTQTGMATPARTDADKLVIGLL